MAAKPKPKRYRVLAEGLNYPAGDGERRAEHGDLVDDIPDKSLPWLLKQGLIEPEEGKD